MLRRTEPVVSLVPRFGARVQSERAAAPTSWTRRFARKPAGAATASSRSARRVIAATRIARRRVARPPAARSVRAARRRHRRSPEGRLDHRDHQRAYRARVRDQTSRRPAPPVTLPADTSTDRSPTAPLVGALRCMVCGRESAWLLPPPWRIRRVSPEAPP